ncbi:MAG: NADH-quinone oxidoreductase subunit J [Acidobacteria bacterium]|nr:NADH-quinone oxidoreductase subunit J [Acidobacteriota bacterium]
MQEVLFYIFALLAIAGALSVILQKKTMYAAISLVITFMAVSIIYFLLGAQFIGLLQLIIYAGAIMVLFLIVILLLDPFSEIFLRNQSLAWVGLAVLLGAGLFGILYTAFGQAPVEIVAPPVPPGELTGHTQSLADVLFKQYLLPFEVISILILVAILGAVILAKKRIS